MAFRLSKYRDIHFNDIDGTGVFELTTIVYCDTVADLPGADDIENFHLALGCKAIIVDTGERYYIGSDGQWYLDESGGGGSEPVLIEKNITENGTYTASDDSADGYSAVTVNVSSGGGGSVSPKDVNFYDYDGTIVYSYSAADFANLSAMPENPTHDGLTAQGWNWTLSDAKTYVAANGKLNIGQMYTTSDGKTHIHIVLEDGRLEPVLGLGVNGSVDIDWGDGSEHTTLTGTNVSTYVSTSPHTYAAAGAYTITLTVTGSMSFVPKNDVCGLLMKSGYNANESRCYRNAIKSVNAGNSVTSIGDYAFNSCSSLSSITIPDSVTSIGQYVFINCSSLSSITIPDSVTSIGQYAFSNCYSLSSITIPDIVTSIGQYVFNSCYSLSSITIPDGVTSIGSNAFPNCYGFGKITFTSETPPTAGSNAFTGIPTDCKIYVPTGSLSAYTSAQNYPSSSTYTYIEY